MKNQSRSVRNEGEMIDLPALSRPLYTTISYIITPAVPLFLRRRLSRGKEDAKRLKERFGYPSQTRPQGKLIWLHAASVGEFISTLSLINQLRKSAPKVSLLVTTGTVTSAAIAEKRLPAGVLHQFIPVDSPVYVDRFLKNWRPDLVLWLESELWPNLLTQIKEANIPAILLNARISDKSYKRWRKYPKTLQSLLNSFTLLSAQSVTDRDKLKELAKERDVLLPGNLKQAAAPLAVNQDKLRTLKEACGNRQVIVFASTHSGDETAILEILPKYAKKENLTIIIPRHPERGDEVCELVRAAGFSAAQRSLDESVTIETQVYIADTLGELGLFYSLANIAVIGGSITGKTGGHNPVEAALLDCAILTGPDMRNFADINSEMIKADALTQVSDIDALQQEINRLLKDKKQRQAKTRNAKNWAEDQSSGILNRVEKIIMGQLKKSDKTQQKKQG